MNIVTLPLWIGCKGFFTYDVIEFNNAKETLCEFALKDDSVLLCHEFILVNYINDFNKKREIYLDILKTHNPTIVRKLFRILYSGNFEFEGTAFELIITLLQLSRLANLLNIPKLGDGMISIISYMSNNNALYVHVDVKYDGNKKMMLTYHDCFVILETLNDTKIIDYSDKTNYKLLPSGFLQNYFDNAFPFIKSYFENPDYKDFINLTKCIQKTPYFSYFVNQTTKSITNNSLLSLEDFLTYAYKNNYNLSPCDITNFLEAMTKIYVNFDKGKKITSPWLNSWLPRILFKQSLFVLEYILSVDHINKTVDYLSSSICKNYNSNQGYNNLIDMKKHLIKYNSYDDDWWMNAIVEGYYVKEKYRQKSYDHVLTIISYKYIYHHDFFLAIVLGLNGNAIKPEDLYTICEKKGTYFQYEEKYKHYIDLLRILAKYHEFDPKFVELYNCPNVIKELEDIFESRKGKLTKPALH